MVSGSEHVSLLLHGRQSLRLRTLVKVRVGFATTTPGSVALSDCVCMPGYTGPDGGPCQACVADKFKATSGSSGCTDWSGIEAQLRNIYGDDNFEKFLRLRELAGVRAVTRDRDALEQVCAPIPAS